MDVNSIKLSICLSCGAKCCKGPNPSLTIFDILRISSYLKISPIKFIKRYTEVYNHFEYFEKIFPEKFGYKVNEVLTILEKYKDVVSKVVLIKLKKKKNSIDCIFLTSNNLCSIYPVRPMVCRIYPIKLVGIDENCELSKRKDLLKEEEELLNVYVSEIYTHYKILYLNEVNSFQKLINFISRIQSIEI